MKRSKEDLDQSQLPSDKKKLINQKKLKDEKKISDLSLQISKLSYEDSLKELDLILNQLQDETLLVEELQISYLKASLYLQHCELLLERIEQEVIQIDIKEQT